MSYALSFKYALWSPDVIVFISFDDVIAQPAHLATSIRHNLKLPNACPIGGTQRCLRELRLMTNYIRPWYKN